MNTYAIIGIDGGATKTTAWCADSLGNRVGQGFAGSSNLTVNSPQVVKANLEQAIVQATKSKTGATIQLPIKKMVVGLSGLDTDGDFRLAEHLVSSISSQFKIQQYKVMNDSEIALASGTANANALVVIAGTGSNCYGRNEAGRTAKSGGLDYLLSDEGSGYSLGLGALKLVTQMSDGRRTITHLQQAIFEYFQINSIYQLKQKVYSPLLTKSDLAKIASVVINEASSGDAAAQELLVINIKQLLEMVRAVLTHLELENQSATVVCTGGLTHHQHFINQFNLQINEQFPQLEIVYPTDPPVVGALLLALDQ